MLKDVEWAEDGTYTTQGECTPVDFFDNALSNSNRFDLELGYFNSAAINILSRSFATFIRNGGVMRMAINNIVSKSDREAIESGLNGGLVAPFDLDDWDSLFQGLDEYGEHFFKCLSYLIQEKRIKIQIIKPKTTTGIAHTKRGVFSDGDVNMSFTGSANFTLGGLINNREEINISFSTSPDILIRKRISNLLSRFDLLMDGDDKTVEYLSSEDLVDAISQRYQGQEIEELIEVEKQLKRFKLEKCSVSEDSSFEYNAPSFPYSSGPRTYQQEAFDRWLANRQKGLFAMATGTGKTITSLNCLLEIYKRKHYYKAIILVPTTTLVAQWESECRRFHFTNIVKVYSKNPNWKDDIDRIAFNERYHLEDGKESSYIIITTYASFARQKTFLMLNSFAPQKLLFIADECHNMGSPSILKNLNKIAYGRRIGLSATPSRKYDLETNNLIYKFFNSEEGFTYEYSMGEAIQNGVLCKYLYYPHLIELTETEMKVYSEISEKISKYYNYSTGCFDGSDEILKRLLLARKRIIHKAHNKLPKFKEIISSRLAERGDLKYTLIYVPEGSNPDYLSGNDFYDKCDTIEDDVVSDKLIDEYTKAVFDLDENITVRKFISGQSDREEILSKFSSGKIQVLTSMKCLDEGVDVPRSELAIFCASTGNPRQFIQRRGRVLRTHPDKDIAILHDLIVAPQIGSGSISYRMEQSLLKNELERVRDFAMLSLNPTDAEIELNPTISYYGLNIYDNKHIAYDK